ncbi:hypothetical protein PILCRDRAFT_830335 [Piloderma croceum F 1598]|uniref:Uncharacterized protein n=1 Tax=Piloderma croceum (strain F 1598) TaxID=765440 RepID=A0A0C3EFH4_PILCF|nr:hypothetical protein PILCRDRAFT_830335 [Piloderma croceum F 1598]
MTPRSRPLPYLFLILPILHDTHLHPHPRGNRELSPRPDASDHPTPKRRPFIL